MVPSIAFFDTKPYDEQFFSRWNESYHFDITFLQSKLSEHTVSLTKEFDAICVFVNDTLNEAVVEKLAAHDIKLIALRCAGYNNVD
ncbi:MAG: 2-hydroxyacid dehydrogenase, partial [Chitinivibrionales bacterium]|nr:2-hydroxyacid dehydrogenase [Chitinivibrionales bacterium]